MPQIISTICKPDGFYGLYRGELNEGTAYLIGRAYAQLVRARRVLIGRDMSSDALSLERSFVKGLIEEGVGVDDLGVVDAAYLAFASNQSDYDGCVLVCQFGMQANTPELGFALSRSRAVPFTAREYESLLALVRQGVPDRRVAPGALLTKDHSAMYVEVLTRNRTIGALSLVVDVAHGMAGLTLPAILSKFPQLKIVALRTEPTLALQEKHSVLSEQLIKLKGAIRQNHADLGAYFSPTGQGLCVVTAQGELLSDDQLATLLAKRQLIKHAGASVVHQIQSSWVVPEEVREAGGAPVAAAGDHVSMSQAMREHRAVLAAGAAGRFYFKDIYGTANAEYALLELLEIITDAKKPLADLVSSLKRYAESGLTRYQVADPTQFVETVAKAFPLGKIQRGASLSEEGLTIEYPDWHLTLKTLPQEGAVALSIEARQVTQLAKIRKQVHDLLIAQASVAQPASAPHP